MSLSGQIYNIWKSSQASWNLLWKLLYRWSQTWKRAAAPASWGFKHVALLWYGKKYVKCQGCTWKGYFSWLSFWSKTSITFFIWNILYKQPAYFSKGYYTQIMRCVQSQRCGRKGMLISHNSAKGSEAKTGFKRTFLEVLYSRGIIKA